LVAFYSTSYRIFCQEFIRNLRRNGKVSEVESGKKAIKFAALSFPTLDKLLTARGSPVIRILELASEDV
jgi:hypothetical protein